MAELVIHQIPVLRDNYVYLAHDPETKATGVVDPEVSEPVLAALDAMRAKGIPTVPATLGEELATNPFLRADKPELQRAAGLEGSEPALVFGEIRRRKDNF